MRQTGRRIRGLHVIMDMMAADDVKERLGQRRANKEHAGDVRGPAGKRGGFQMRRRRGERLRLYMHVFANRPILILGEQTRRLVFLFFFFRLLFLTQSLGCLCAS